MGNESTSTSSPGYDKLSGETQHDNPMSFEGLGLDTNDSLETTEVTPEKSVVAQTAQTPTAPAAQAPVVPPVAQQPQAQPVAQATVQAQPTEVTSQPQSLESVIQAFATNEAEMTNQLAANFAIDPALAEELETNYAQAVPKLLASTFVKAVHTSLQYMQQYVPQIVEKSQAEARAYQEAEKAFFGQFPDLNVSNHGNDIQSFARAFVSHNPKITRDELFTLVGNAVRGKYGLTNQVQAKPPVSQAQRPFAPAGNSAPISLPVAQTEVSPFWGLGQEHET